MSKSKTKTKTASEFADRILAHHLSPDELYNQILSQVSEDDFVAMENKILASVKEPFVGITEAEQRAIWRQEAIFMLGLELGRRIGGAR